MLNNEFRRPVSVDSAPRGSSCEWCGQPAEHQLIAIGGDYHNESGLFCKPCGEQFSLAIIARSTRNNATTNQQFM